MSTIEEMRETFRRAWRVARDDPTEALDAAIMAVIEKHIRPMIKDAHLCGWEREEFADDYTARILSALTATGRE